MDIPFHKYNPDEFEAAANDIAEALYQIPLVEDYSKGRDNGKDGYCYFEICTESEEGQKTTDYQHIVVQAKHTSKEETLKDYRMRAILRNEKEKVGTEGEELYFRMKERSF